MTEISESPRMFLKKFERQNQLTKKLKEQHPQQNLYKR